MRLPRLKEVRELHGFSQTKLAEESGVSRDSISNYETGHREAYPATAKKLADALDVGIADLIEPARELTTAGKAEAPREAGRGQTERLEDLQEYAERLSKITKKYRAEVKALDAERDEDLDRLITLLAQTAWTFDGAYEFVDNDDAVKQAEKGAPAERRAAKKVNDALNAIADVNEAIMAALEPHLEPDEEEHRVVTRIEEYRQRRAG